MRRAACLFAAIFVGCVAKSEPSSPPFEPPIDPPVQPPDQPPVPCTPAPPAHVALRRLNKVELDNTTRDLIGTETHFAEALPDDPIGLGFDNIGDVQTLSPLEIELYSDAGEAIVGGPLAAPLQPINEHYEAELLQATNGTDPIGGPDGDSYWFNTIGALTSKPYAFRHGTYRVTIAARGVVENMIVPPQMSVILGTQVNRTVTVEAPDIYQLRIEIDDEVGELHIGFLNPYYQPVHRPLYEPPTACVTNEDDDTECSSHGTGNTCLANMCRVFTQCTSDADCAAGNFCGAGDGCGTRRTCCLDPSPQRRELWVDWFEIEGPIEAPPPPNELRNAIVDCTVGEASDVCARSVVGKFARRAWRRPVLDEELDALTALVTSADTFDQGIDVALRALLLSPSFLFRAEGDGPLDDHQLAVRLSYFLWSTMPDDELAALADASTLKNALPAQIDRMLADPKARQLTRNFGGQWLQIRSIADVHPSTMVFPDFDDATRNAMHRDAINFFDSFLDQDRALSDVVGFLTMRGFLTMTSNPDRTSVVKRGKWILEQLLCIHLPPPPPNVEGLLANIDPTLPLKERMAQHRNDPACAACHAGMDPLGFALEHYDAIGRWRDVDEHGNVIDATGMLPDGRAFDGAEELAAMLAQDPGVLHCAAQNMMTYAIGAAPDACTVDHLVTDWSQDQYGFRSLIDQTVLRLGGEP